MCAQSWHPESTSDTPPARRFHALAHVGGSEILFGGIDEQRHVVFGDTWRYNGLSWTELPIVGPGPRARFAACVDLARDVLIVFGGADSQGRALDDTWEFDGASWRNLRPAVSPPPRLGAAMVFDFARRRVVMFGGGPDASSPTAETWEFDGIAWSRSGPNTSPPARVGHAMTFETTRGAALLFGGRSPTGDTLLDTWRWDGLDWTEVSTTNRPTAAVFPAMTFFEAHDLAVLSGSTGSAASTLATWIFDGVDWSTGPDAPVGLHGRQGQAMAYDRAREMVVLFGGARIARGGASPLADTWELAIHGTAEPFGDGCALGTQFPRLTPHDGSRPQLGSEFQLALAPAGVVNVFLLGLSDRSILGLPLPLDLTPVGLPGCALRVSLDDTRAELRTGDTAMLRSRIPLLRSLLGAEYFVQAMAVDVAIATPIAFSNGVRITIGN